MRAETSGVERGRLTRAVFFADGAPAHGEYATARPRTRFEHAAVVADLAKLVCGSQTASPPPRTNTRTPATRPERAKRVWVGAASRPRPVIASYTSDAPPAAAARLRNDRRVRTIPLLSFRVSVDNVGVRQHDRCSVVHERRRENTASQLHEC
jgi:hypothetical protein